MADNAAPLPHRPETLESLKARYHAALERVYTLDDAISGRVLLAGRNPANVFDFEDGLRLVVSRIRLPSGPLTLNISASVALNGRVARDAQVLCTTGQPASKVYAAWLRSIPRRFRELSGDNRELLYLGHSGNLLPHFAIEEESACPL